MELSEKRSNNNSFWINFFKAPTVRDDFTLLLKSMPPFADLEDKHIKYLMKIIHNRVFSSNEFIFKQGDPGIALYIIRNGEVSIQYKDEDSNIYEMVTLEKGDFFGELALLDHDVRSASAIAVKETNASVIFKPDLDEFINKYPAIGINILKGISNIVATRLRNLDKNYVTLYYQKK